MKYHTNVTGLVLLLILLCWALPRTAYAYIDPGTGSYLFQLLIAGLFAGAFAVKIFWKKIKAFFSAGKDDPDADDE